MTQAKLRILAEVGQPVWLDYTERSFVGAGGLQNYIDIGDELILVSRDRTAQDSGISLRLFG